MRYCPQCGAKVADGHRFCAECGARLPDRQELPPEPVYTEDPELLQNPVLNTSPDFTPPEPKEDRVPELTLEPDLWGIPAAAAQSAPQPESPAAQEPVFASVAAEAVYDNPLREERERLERERLEQERRAEARRDSWYQQSQAAAQTRPVWQEEAYQQGGGAQELPHDYTMSAPPRQERSMPDETAMLIWAIILTATFSFFGLIGLLKVVKARKQDDLGVKAKLLSDAKTWLIIGTVFRVLGAVSAAF